MKKLNVLQAKWSAAIRAELPNAKGDVLRATSLAAQKNPRLRAHLLAAANPGKKTRAVDDEIEDDELLDDEELTEDEDEPEDAPATKRKSNAKKAKANRR
jgi:hypothetical protein